ncbi:hypothetical protein NDU88_004771 [Pleurodeles waltl]|uniref:Uncharacterized protein n=1 Tax=Pleurodeles waltl TaxID=8319 RepID=A0AAV7QFG6_PLEWA|nr:hypothetical protein NDU88_004771 [Pleurodeles waltl]
MKDQQRTLIGAIRHDGSSMVSMQADINDAFQDNYCTLYGAMDHPTLEQLDGFMDGLPLPHVSLLQRADLEEPTQLEETRVTIAQIA